MAQTSNITDVFEIYFDTDAGTGTYLLTNPGRGFKIINVLGTGANNGVATCKKGAGGSTFAVMTLAGSAAPSTMSVITDGNTTFGSADHIEVVVTTAAVTRLVFQCVASTGYALTTAKTA